MPPPASPIFSSSYSYHARCLDSEASSATCSDYLEAQGKALQDNIPLVISKDTSFNLSSRPESSASFRSTTMDEQSLVEQLQSRIDALEYENERLRLASGNEFASALPEQLESLERERDEAIAKISYLEEKQAASNSNVEAHTHRISLLEQDLKRITSERDTQQLKDQSCVANLQKKVEEDILVIQELQASLTVRSNLVDQQHENLEVKETEIALLNLKLQSMFKELEEEKRELGAQIDELRIAGQVLPRPSSLVYSQF
jgi:CAP-Gly domain-containing linker protein 1